MKYLILIGVIVIIIIIVYIFVKYNRLVKEKLKVEQSKSGIDIYLKQRFDLIPNLLECVKGYMKYEKEILAEITELRTKYNEDNKNLEIGTELNNKVNHLLAVVENYPELKSNEQFIILQKNLVKTENQLQAARRLYNIDVTNYNTSIGIFPSNIIAGIFKFQKEDLFELENKEQAQNININL